MSARPPSDDLRLRAEELLAERLADAGEEDALDLDALCAEHPELVDALREVGGSWRWFEEAVDPAASEPRAAERGVLEALADGTEGAPYQTLEEVAQGGMGTVYRVWDPRLKRELAMKVSAARVRGSGEGSGGTGTSSLPVYRFLEEAQVMAQLDHPGVVPVHDIGLDEHGHLRFTMRLVQGQDFKGVLELVHTQSGGWTRSRALEVLIKVCETVAYAHSKLVVHRDLKPSNVMVGRFGQVYVMDWGLARVLGRPDTRREELLSKSGVSQELVTERNRDSVDVESGLRTQEGAVVGTPAYMPPEQARGELERIGTRSDVYAIGAMLYHLLTGRAPYTDQVSGSAELVFAVGERAPTPVATLAPDAPAELVAVCAKAMARRLEDRYAQVLELAEDLRAFLEHRPVSVLRAGALAQSRKWLARNRLAGWALAAALVATLAGVSGWATVQAGRARSEAQLESELAEARSSASSLASELGAERSRAEVRRYAASVAAAQSALSRPAVARARLADCPPELRGFEWRYLDRCLDSSSRVLTEPGLGRVWGLVFSPDGERLYASGETTRILAWNVGTGQLEASLDGLPGTSRALVAGPGLRWIAATDQQGNVAVWDPGSGELLNQWRAHGSDALAAAAPADADLLATCGHDGLARLWTVPDGDLLQELVHGTPTLGVDVSPAADRIATAATDGTLALWDARSGERLALRKVQGGSRFQHWPVRFSPAGDELVFGGHDGVVRVIDGVTLEARAELVGHQGKVCALEFVDGDRLVSTSFDCSVRVWSLRDRRLLGTLTGHGSGPLSAGGDRDRDLLATGDGRGNVRLWSLAEALDPGAAFPVGTAAMGLACHGDLAAAGSEESLVVWNVLEGKELWRRELERVVSVAWTADGEVLGVGTFAGHVATLDASSGATIERFERHEGETCVAFGPRGELLASGGGRDVRVATLQGGGVRSFSLDEAVSDLVFHPTAPLLVVGAERGRVYVLDLDGGGTRSIQAHSGRRVSVAFDDSGSLLATGSRDGTVTLWDASRWEPRLAVASHPGYVLDVALSHDGSRLATSCSDQAVRLFEVRTGVEVACLLGHGAWISGVVFGPQDVRLLSVSSDTTARVWEAR